MNYQHIWRKIGRFAWPFGLFIIYGICQLLAVKAIWLSLIITGFVLAIVLKYQNIKPRKFKHQILTKILLILGLLLLLLLTISIYSLCLHNLGLVLPMNPNQAHWQKMSNRFLFVTACETLIMAPIFEESIFRLGIISFKNKYWLIGSNILSISVFALCHLTFSVNLLLFIIYAIPGLYLTLIYDYTRDLKCNMLLHFLYNAIVFLTMMTTI